MDFNVEVNCKFGELETVFHIVIPCTFKLFSDAVRSVFAKLSNSPFRANNAIYGHPTHSIESIYPLCYAVLDAENSENRSWFVNRLAEFLIPRQRTITFLSDRNQGLLDAVKRVFSMSPHSYCLFHVKNNLRAKFLGAKLHDDRKKLVEIFNKYAYAYKPFSFNKYINELVAEGEELVEEYNQVSTLEEIEKYVNKIKMILESMEGGELTTAGYDTAMVALVEDINGSGSPQFPSCLEWIANNQMEDGSWGAPYLFAYSDRLINTLACIVALKKWNLHPHKIQKGITFFKENFNNLANENDEHMLIGFEIAFPGLVQKARKYEIEVPDDSHPILKDINAKRDYKLSKIPKEVLHMEHTTLLFSAEGLEDLDMEKLLKLQCPDGSMLYSPASTAHVLTHTKDPNCLKYLNHVVDRSNGGVPYIYPVDMFARNWAIDQLQRLGISRYFVPQIDHLVSYVSRLHGHDISPDAFWHFKYGDAFCCFPRQTSESVTAIFDLFRATQLQFPREKVMDEAKNFSYNFLRKREANNTLIDKWVILKDLPGEVGYALDMPFFANLPRVETRIYIEQYGGEEDVWIGKTLYQMKEVNNNTYLALAKLDYNICQEKHQNEWQDMLRWYRNNKLVDFRISEGRLLLAYFLATGNIFERERLNERLGWAKSSILVEIVSTYINKELTSYEQRQSFIHGFRSRTSGLDKNGYNVGGRLTGILRRTLYQLSMDAMEAHGGDILQPLLHAWETCLMTWQEDDVIPQSEAVLLATTTNIFADRLVSGELLSHPQYKRLMELTGRICRHLYKFQDKKVQDDCKGNTKSSNITTVEIESDMQELLQLVLQKSEDGIDSKIKQTFLAVTNSYYYTTYCSPTTINIHMDKVLF
ncbi:hypothetical protein LguiB_001974 [Lonicera macranthoides]